MVAGLRNVDESLARDVADGLGLPELPDGRGAGPAADHRPARVAGLSIAANGPDSFAGRKIGVLVSDGVDPDLLDGLRTVRRRRASSSSWWPRRWAV